MKSKVSKTAISVKELYAKGYTIRQAARIVKRSDTHIRAVLNGHRIGSPALMESLGALPARELKLRRAIEA